MIVEEKQGPNYLCFTLKGELDLYNTQDFKSTLQDRLLSRPENLILHLPHLNYIDSSGIGVLIYIFTFLRQKGKKLILSQVSHQVSVVIDMTSLTGLFPITPDLNSAILMLGKSECKSEQMKQTNGSLY